MITYDEINLKVITKDLLGERWNTSTDTNCMEIDCFSFFDKNKINNVFYFGCHQSIIPIKISKLILKNACFVCFEASKYNYKISLENIHINNCQNKIKIINKAISTYNGFEYFGFFDLNKYKTKKKILSYKIECNDFMTLVKMYQKPDLIYFDIEGMEGPVIKSAISYISSWKNNIFIECHGDEILSKHNSSNAKIYELLKKNNYQLKMNNINYPQEPRFIDINKNLPKSRFYLLAKNF